VSYEEYIKKLDELKLKAERAIIQNLPDLERDAEAFLVRYLDEHFDTKAGNLLANEVAAQGLGNFTDIYLQTLTELESYQGTVGQYLKNFKSIGDLMTEFQADNGVDVKQARLGAVQEVVVGEIVNQYSENGLNKGFVQPLREILFKNVSGGLNKRRAIEQLHDYIASGKDTTGKLGQYLTQTAQQGVDSYSGAINTRILQTFKIDTLLMSGSLIKTSSPQCRYGIEKLGGIIDRSDWPRIEKIAKENGLIEGTTFDTLPVNKFHWGCRHEFTAMVLDASQRKNLLSNPVNN